jgi:hypothetical protein
MKHSHLFITGAYRSGTTLTEKILHNHRDICLASQPFPLLYIYAKKAFLEQQNLQRRYPLDHLFMETSYSARQWHDFLDTFHFSSDLLADMFWEMSTYSGLWTRETLRLQPDIKPGAFLDVFRQFQHQLPRLLGKESVSVTGSKEILCEEYIPYLLANNVKVILVVRDPRDMITSLNFRKRDNMTGKLRPILYSLRVWRKSVAFALGYQDHPDLLWLRYEDLIAVPMDVLNKVTAFLGLSAFTPDFFREGIRDQNGKIWMGNSSFDDMKGISTDSVGKYRRVLDRETIAYIETVCLPEMRSMGYECQGVSTFSETALRSLTEPAEEIHDKFSPDYSTSPEQVARETERYRRIVSSDPCPETEILPRLLHPAAGNKPGNKHGDGK